MLVTSSTIVSSRPQSHRSPAASRNVTAQHSDAPQAVRNPAHAVPSVYQCDLDRSCPERQDRPRCPPVDPTAAPLPSRAFSAEAVDICRDAVVRSKGPQVYSRFQRAEEKTTVAAGLKLHMQFATRTGSKAGRIVSCTVPYE
ncbi:hypothetical protein KC360_g143 [Hortaea werneckii]|nr:hypothetical protein KC360_g143 [Hortaea werneckii]